MDRLWVGTAGVGGRFAITVNELQTRCVAVVGNGHSDSSPCTLYSSQACQIYVLYVFGTSGRAASALEGRFGHDLLQGMDRFGPWAAAAAAAVAAAAVAAVAAM